MIQIFMIVMISATLLWIVKVSRSGDNPVTPEKIALAYEIIRNEGCWRSLGSLNGQRRDKAVRSCNVGFTTREVQNRWEFIRSS